MEIRRKLYSQVFVALTVIIVSIKRIQSYPMYDPQDPEIWSENGPSPIWLPASVLQDEENLQDIYSIAEIEPSRQMNFIDKPLKAEFFIEETKTRSPPAVRQIGNNRLVKKDSFVSRNWGAGGLPFSVLYMNSHGSRSSQSTDSTKQADAKRPMAAVEPSKNTNTRLTTRNGANVQPRRQYSMIPQLFISYGWNSLAKKLGTSQQ